MITIELLRQTGGLGAFSDAELEILLGASLPRTFAAGDVLCRQGRAGTSCFVIVSGIVEVLKEDGAGGHRLLTRLSAGTIAGQLALVDGAPRNATLAAHTNVVALELTRDVFHRLVGASSPLAFRFQMQVHLARLVPGDIIGEGACIDPAPRSAATVAHSPAVLLELNRQSLERMAVEQPKVASVLLGAIIQDLTHRLRDVDRRVEAATLRRLQDAVADIDVPFEPFDIVEITPPERIAGPASRPA